MSDYNKDLAEVRGWLCENLSSGEAGKVCGMLSSVSRRINEIEAENAKLREALKSTVNCRRFGGCFTCPMFHEDAQPNEMCGNDMLMNRLGIEVQDDRR